MKTNLLTTVATVGFTLMGASLVFAQDNPNEKKDRPASERMEKAAPRQSGERMDNGMKQEPTSAARKRDETEPRAGQAEPKKQAGETRTGQAMEPKKEDSETRTGQAAEPKRKEGETRTGETMQPKAKETDKCTGQSAEPKRQEGAARAMDTVQPPRRDDAARTDQTDKPATSGRVANDRVKVTGNLHVSEERASRISETLMSKGRHEHIDERVVIGQPLPETIAFEPLPPEIVELAPEYRGYDYVVSDDEIIFVQPSTHEVVGMIAADETTAGDVSSVSRAKPCPVD